MHAALRYLTGLPVEARSGGPWSVVAFPLFGAVVGLGWVLGSRILYLLPRTTAVAAAAILIVDALMTRAVHLRGLTQAVDAVTGPDDVEQAFREERGSPALVLRPLVGAGVSALVLIVLLRFSVLFFAADFDYRLVTVPLSGRAAMVWLVWRATRKDPAEAPVPAAFGRPAAPALLLTAALSLGGALIGGARGLEAVVLATTVGAAWGLWWHARMGPLSAAALAAGGLIAETVALLAIGAV